MVTIIQDLRREHVNMARLLDLLEQEVRSLEEDEGTDYDLMMQIVDYTMCYLDLFHHPKEDIVFKHFLERMPEAVGIITPLLKEHKVGERMTREFFNLLKGITVGGVVSREQFEKAAQDYIRFSRRHIATEERDVFPRIEEVLRAEDWDAIMEEMPGADDPLFGDFVKEPYQDLYQRITSVPEHHR